MPLLETLIPGAIGLIGQGINNSLTNSYNKQQVKFWNMQNEYNSPKKQMERYKEAGLNPHLIYGQGTPGLATGTPEQKPKEFQTNAFIEAANAYLDLKAKDVSIDRQKEGLEVDKLNTLHEYWLNTHMDGDVDSKTGYLSQKERAYIAKRESMQQGAESAKTGSDIAKGMYERGDVIHQIDIERLNEIRSNSYQSKARKDMYERYGILPEDTGEARLLLILYRELFGNNMREQLNNNVISDLFKSLLGFKK